MRLKRYLTGKVKGSITVFLAYLLVFVLATVFALLEISRVWGLEQRADTDVILTTNSLLAGYSAELWDEYGLLFLDGSSETEGSDMLETSMEDSNMRASSMEDSDVFEINRESLDIAKMESLGLAYSVENMDLHGGETGQIRGQTWNLYGLAPQKMEISSYGLATDQNGRAFIEEAVTIMESQIAEDVLLALYERITGEDDTELPMIDVQETTKEVALTENPIEVVERMKSGSVLSLVVDETAISNKNIDLNGTLSARNLEVGTYSLLEQDGMADFGNTIESNVGWKDKLLFRQYLEKYFTCYLTAEEDHGLDYEMEYLVAGKGSDEENLKSVVRQLLVMRELANLQFLQTNVAKQEMVLAAATAISAATLTPELIPVYKTGIMAAWAYAEAVSDVRLLLDGQNVNLVKTEEQWHTDLTSLGQSRTGIQQTAGLSYQEYLQILLWSVTDSKLAYRGMDLIERNTGYNMNHQIYYLSGTLSYQGSALFTSLLSIGSKQKDIYDFQKDFSVTYLKD